MNTKIIAYYLPQFHEIEENNNWWGKGFTEWTHVSKALPLYQGHNQPRIPLNRNYYNLLNKESVIWQANLAKEYGIYGFAYYHYWFDGKLLLEKPTENLLKWKDIPQNFFFFWANHTWYKAKNGKKTILIEQNDGGVEDWINHYNYMCDFFFDNRYIKIDGKPVIGIYDVSNLNCLDEMLDMWNKLAKQDGFNGVYVIENRIKKNQKKYSQKTQAIVCRQPLVALNEFNLKIYKRILRKLKKIMHLTPKVPQRIQYNVIADLESKYKPHKNEHEFFGISVGWDNTPRHGKYGQVFINQNVEQFEKALERLVKKSLERKNEFFFINAWNEWAEGMYLEPDETNKYEYLMAVQRVVNKNGGY